MEGWWKWVLIELKRCTLSCPNPNSIIKHSREVSFSLSLFVHALSISSPTCHLSIECDAISDQVTPSKASNKTHSTVHFNSLLLAPVFHFAITLTCRICMRRWVRPHSTLHRSMSIVRGYECFSLVEDTVPRHGLTPAWWMTGTWCCSAAIFASGRFGSFNFAGFAVQLDPHSCCLLRYFLLWYIVCGRAFNPILPRAIWAKLRDDNNVQASAQRP